MRAKIGPDGPLVRRKKPIAEHENGQPDEHDCEARKFPPFGRSHRHLNQPEAVDQQAPGELAEN
ncbi:hypothetical protein [Breoghania sp.]|uniref:hypothetical protein n=1 Tax=Breoghania sp. TaxID=2065378 RepID=UPI00262880F2|nr:hypothetical protein [Breoghania sp.]MDJ0930225.1 hypothetical protein [Breoghania sp.]